MSQERDALIAKKKEKKLLLDKERLLSDLTSKLEIFMVLYGIGKKELKELFEKYFKNFKAKEVKEKIPAESKPKVNKSKEPVKDSGKENLLLLWEAGDDNENKPGEVLEKVVHKQ